MTDRVGQQRGNYRLERLLGRGGFAEVYLGEHIFLKTQAAIKVLLTQLSDEDMESFLKESRTIANLNHPHIVRVLEFGVDETIPFLVMDLAPNGSLRPRYAKNTRLEPSAVAVYLNQAADGLHYAHEQKIIHRDVKPENLLLGKRGEVLVGDFGIALIGQSSRYQSTQNVVGTVSYMSPEQIRGKPRTASDQYSLGIVVYEWLAGERPYYGSFAELCAQHMYATPPPLRQKGPDISPALEQVVMTALEKDPAQRFPTIQAFAIAFEQASQSVELIQEQMPTMGSTPVPIPSSPVLSATLLPDQHPTKKQNSQFDETLAAGSSRFAGTRPVPTGADSLAGTLPVPTRAQSAMDTPVPTVANSTGVSGKLATPVTPFPVLLPFPTPATPPAHTRYGRGRMSLARVALIALAVAIVFVSGLAVWTHRGPSSSGPAPALTPGLTTTPNGVAFVPTGTGGATRVPLQSSPTGQSGVLPSGTTQTPPTVTNAPSQTVTVGLDPTVTTPPPTVTVAPPPPPPTQTTPPPTPPTPGPSPTSVPAMLSFSQGSFPNASGCSYAVGSGWTCPETLSVNADATQNLSWNVSASNPDITFSSYGTTMSPGQSMQVTIFVPDRACPVTAFFLFAATNQGNGINVNWNCNAVVGVNWGGCSVITTGSAYQCTMTPYMVAGGQGELFWTAKTASGAVFQPTSSGTLTPGGNLTTISVTTGCDDTFTVAAQGGSMGMGNTVVLRWAC